MSKKGIIIEFFKYKLINNKDIPRDIFDYTTVVKISLAEMDVKESIVLMTTGQISKLDQKTLLDNQSIFQIIHELDPKAIEKTNNADFAYQFNVPVHFKWSAGYCPSIYEEKFKGALDLSAKTIHIADFVELKRQSFSLSAFFNDEVTFETKYKNTDFFLDLNINGIFLEKVNIENFKGSMDFSNSHFKEKVKMKNLQCTSIDFSESTFDNQLKIQRGVFENIANFYNTTFKLSPILSEVVFEKKQILLTQR